MGVSTFWCSSWHSCMWYEACADVSSCTTLRALESSPTSSLPIVILDSLERRFAYSSSMAARSFQNCRSSSTVRAAPRRRAMITSYPRSPWPQNALQKSRLGSTGSSGTGPLPPWCRRANEVDDWDRSGRPGSAIVSTVG